MKPETPPNELHFCYWPPHTQLWLQPPLPNFLDTLPILLSIEGSGSVLAGCAPLAPPEEPANA